MLACVVVLYLPFLGNLPLLHEEPRRALIARSMMETGNYLVPMLLNEIYTAKPPLYNWLIVAFSLPAGEVTEYTSRLPSVVFLFFTAMLIVWGMRHYLSVPARVFLGFAILLTPELMAKAHIAEIEIVFTFFVTLSIWSWFWLFDQGHRGFKLWLFPLIIVGLSFLTKREPSIVFFYFSVVPFLIFNKKLKALFTIGHIGSFIVMCLIIGSWLLIMVDSVGVEALLQSLRAEVINRGLTTSVSDYLKHIVLYPLALFVSLLPFSLLLFALIKRKTRSLVKNRYGALYLFALMAVLVNLPLYWIRGDAAVRYFLPMFPTILVLITLLFEMYYWKSANEDLIRVIGRTVKTCAVIFVIVTIGLLVTASLPFWSSPPTLLVPWQLVLVVAIAVVIIALKLLRLAFQDSTRVILPVFIGVLVAAKLVYFSSVLPFKIERVDINRNGAKVMLDIEKQVPEGEKIQVSGHIHYSLWFYAKPGHLIVPGKLDVSVYKGYILAYENDPLLKNLTGNGFKQILKTDYRDRVLILGKVIQF